MARKPAKVGTFEVEVEGQKMEVVLRLDRATMTFTAEHAESGWTASGKDGEALKKEAREHFAKWAALEWVLYVAVKATHTQAMNHFEFNLHRTWFAVGSRGETVLHVEVPEPREISDARRAEAPWDGTWEPGSRWSGRSEGTPGLPREGELRHSWGGEKGTMVVLRATPEVVDALLRLEKRTERLGKGLAALLREEREAALDKMLADDALLAKPTALTFEEVEAAISEAYAGGEDRGRIESLVSVRNYSREAVERELKNAQAREAAHRGWHFIAQDLWDRIKTGGKPS